MSSGIKIPKCPAHKKPMGKIEENDKIITYMCDVKDCRQNIDILKVDIDREDKILENLWGWDDLL